MVDWLFTGLVEFVGGLFVAGGSDGMRRRSDERLLSQKQRVRCAVRAASGRVLDFGAEWSHGTASVSVGRVGFSPRAGLFGDREIQVQRLQPLDLDEPSSRSLPKDQAAFVLETAGGDLHWMLPAAIAARAAACVAPIAD